MGRRQMTAGAVAFLVSLVAGGSLAPASGGRPICEEGWKFRNLHREARKLKVFDRERDENRTGHTAEVTLTSRRGGTFTYQVSASAGGEAGVSAPFGVFSASIKAEFGVSVSRQMTAEIGNNITVPVSPHHALVGKYGIFKMIVSGHLYYLTRACDITNDEGYVTVKTPRQVGWRISDDPL
jgi:hypothetical protein